MGRTELMLFSEINLMRESDKLEFIVTLVSLVLAIIGFLKFEQILILNMMKGMKLLSTRL